MSRFGNRTTCFIERPLRHRETPRQVGTIHALVCRTPLSDSSILSETFQDEIVKETGTQAIADPNLVERSIE